MRDLAIACWFGVLLIAVVNAAGLVPPRPIALPVAMLKITLALAALVTLPKLPDTLPSAKLNSFAFCPIAKSNELSWRLRTDPDFRPSLPVKATKS